MKKCILACVVACLLFTVTFASDDCPIQNRNQIVPYNKHTKHDAEYKNCPRVLCNIRYGSLCASQKTVFQFYAFNESACATDSNSTYHVDRMCYRDPDFSQQARTSVCNADFARKGCKNDSSIETSVSLAEATTTSTSGDSTPKCGLKKPVEDDTAYDVSGCATVECVIYNGTFCEDKINITTLYLPDDLARCTSNKTFVAESERDLLFACEDASEEYKRASALSACQVGAPGGCGSDGSKPKEGGGNVVVWILVFITLLFAGFSIFMYLKSRRDSENPYMDLQTEYDGADDLRV